MSLIRNICNRLHKLTNFSKFPFMLLFFSCTLCVHMQEYLAPREHESECFKRSGRLCFSRSLIGWIRSPSEDGEDEPSPFLHVVRILMMSRTHKWPSLLRFLSLGPLKGTVHLCFNCQSACRYSNVHTVWHNGEIVLPFIILHLTIFLLAILCVAMPGGWAALLKSITYLIFVANGKNTGHSEK